VDWSDARAAARPASVRSMILRRLVLILVENGNRGADPQGGTVIGEREARAKQNPNPRTLTWVILKTWIAVNQLCRPCQAKDLSTFRTKKSRLLRRNPAFT